MSDVGLLVVRVVVGSFMASHGLPKLRDSDGEYAKSFEKLGFHPGSTFVRKAAAVETSAAALIALGLFGPLGPMLLLSDMIVAMASVAAREKKFTPNKHELEAAYAAVAVLLALSGPGRLAVDRLLRIDVFDKPSLRYTSLAAAVAGAAFMLASRQDQDQPPASTSG
jgi:putative oxidoreductase